MSGAKRVCFTWQARPDAGAADLTRWLSNATAGQASTSLQDADVAGPGVTLMSTGSFNVRLSPARRRQTLLPRTTRRSQACHACLCWPAWWHSRSHTLMRRCLRSAPVLHPQATA